jgi:hypothetical protein
MHRPPAHHPAPPMNTATVRGARADRRRLSGDQHHEHARTSGVMTCPDARTRSTLSKIAGVLHFVTDADDVYEIVTRLKAAMAPGSYLVVSPSRAMICLRKPQQARGNPTNGQPLPPSLERTMRLHISLTTWTLSRQASSTLHRGERTCRCAPHTGRSCTPAWDESHPNGTRCVNEQGPCAACAASADEKGNKSSGPG